MSRPENVLIFAEDPGACNYLRDLPKYLTDAGIANTLLCSGAGVAYLRSRGVSFIEANHKTAADLLDRYSPSLVVVGTSEVSTSLAHQLTDECRYRSITTAGAVDMEVNADMRFRGLTDSPLAHAPDWLLVPDESCKLRFEAIGFPSNQIVVAGHPHFDYVRSVASKLGPKQVELRARILPMVPQERVVITFICEGYDLLDRSASLRSAEYTLHGRGSNNFRTAIVLEELLDAVSGISPKPFIVARLHPKMAGDELLEYTDELDYISKNDDPLELLMVSDLIVGMSSILVQEAALMKRTTISMLPRDIEKQWLPTTANGFTKTLSTREEVRGFFGDLKTSLLAINRDAESPVVDNALSNLTKFVTERLVETRSVFGT